MDLTLHLTDAEAALQQAARLGKIANLTTHSGTLHVFLDSVAAYGVFTAALTERLIKHRGRPGGLVYTPAEASAIVAAARNTWDGQLNEKGWTDGGVLGIWYPGVTIIQDPPAERGPCICKGRGGHTDPACPWYGTDQ